MVFKIPKASSHFHWILRRFHFYIYISLNLKSNLTTLPPKIFSAGPLFLLLGIHDLCPLTQNALLTLGSAQCLLPGALPGPLPSTGGPTPSPSLSTRFLHVTYANLGTWWLLCVQTPAPRGLVCLSHTALQLWPPVLPS